MNKNNDNSNDAGHISATSTCGVATLGCEAGITSASFCWRRRDLRTGCGSLTVDDLLEKADVQDDFNIAELWKQNLFLLSHNGETAEFAA